MATIPVALVQDHIVYRATYGTLTVARLLLPRPGQYSTLYLGGTTMPQVNLPDFEYLCVIDHGYYSWHRAVIYLLLACRCCRPLLHKVY